MFLAMILEMFLSFLNVKKNMRKLPENFLRQHFFSKSCHLGGISTFCVFSKKNISQKHFWKWFFVSWKFLVCLANKTTSNAEFCKKKKNLTTRQTWQTKKFGKKFFLNFYFFCLFKWSNCFCLERRTFTIANAILSKIENKREYLKLWMECQNWEFFFHDWSNKMVPSRCNNDVNEMICFITCLGLHFR